MDKLVEQERKFSTTLERGLRVLRAFHASDDGLGNLEISQRTGLPKSTVSRLSFTLTQLGYLRHAGRNNRYRLGPEALALGNVASATLPFVNAAQTIMTDLADQTQTLVCMLIQVNDRLVLAKTWKPTTIDCPWLDVGKKMPLIGSASGHAYLGALPQLSFEQKLPRLASYYAHDEAEIFEIRKHARSELTCLGFTIARPQDRFSAGINAVSVPFLSPEIPEPICFTCGAHPDNLNDHDMYSRVGPLLKQSTEQLARTLQYIS